MAAAGSAVIALLLLWACVPMAHLSEACGWTTTALNGTVQSPYFPANYSNNQSCVYIITAPAGYQVTLNFTDLDIDPTPNCFADFVEIRDGDQSSPAIGRYCNRTIPRQRRTFGNQMWIKFASNGTGTAQGFRATFVSAKLQAPYVLLAASIPGNRFYGIIFRVDVETISNYIIPMSIYPTWPVAVDFDPVEQTVYWTEVGLAKRIGASSINGSGMHTIQYTGPDSVVEGLAVDPLSRLIFYTDSGRNMIAMVTMSTLAHRTILNSSLDQPRAIVLNTAEGLMFWAAGGAVPKIEGARYDGSDRRTLVTTRLSHVNGMALDVSKQRLYWVDGGTNTVEMFDLESKGRTVLHTANSSHYLFGLTLLNNTLYMSDWLGENSTISHILSLEIGSPNLTYRGRATARLNGIKVVQPRLFSNLGVNGCGSNNGGCGSICIPLPNNSSKCMCPDGQTLTRNQTSCVDACPEQSWGVNCSQTCNCSQRATCDVLEGCVCLPGWSGVTCSTDVNECETMTNVCPENHICQNNPGSFVCLCRPGFVKEKNTLCVDIDECRFNPSPCQHFCTNTIGSYQCSCKPGYRKDVINQSLCRDINECQERTHDCHHQCVNTQGSFHCSCFPGFALNTTDNRTCVRETAADPCAALSPPCSYACKNESGALQCLCASGYALAADQRSCEDINECTLNQCSQKCDNTNGSYTCSCLAGFRLDADKVTCNACPANRWGDNCSQTCDCRGRGKCNKVRGCDCHSGWSGVTCSTDVNECETIANACPAKQICQNNPGSFACICPPGFQKVNNTACVDINECAVSSNNTCQQVCTNTPGSYVCSCHEGYTYDAANNTCTDIDECDTNILNCEYKCENFPGAANCICGPGSVLNDDRRTCVKEQDPCASLATSKNCSYACQVVNGSAQCDCAAGFQLNADGATCQDINECSGNHSCNQVCHNTEGNYRCSCSTGYTLDSDQRTCVECDGNHWGDNCNMTCDCNPVGTQRCDKVTGCVCRSGWQGPQCKQDVDECSGTPCSNMTGAQCVNTAGSFRCLCGGGYVMNAKGNACVDINECQQQPGPCDQHCTNTAGSYLCSCQQGFQANGTACIDVDECLNKPCEQICRNTVGGYFCECRPGFIPNDTTRSTCTDIDECLSSPCDYSCNNTAGSYVCMCPMGYQLNATTRHTCQDTNECESNPCINGICSNAPGNFSCSCPPGFYMLSDQLTCQACDAIHYGPNCSGQCTCERANTADCNDVNGSCTCKGGWTGENCTEDVDECSNQATNPCQADTHATCNNTEGGYFCDCVAGYVRASSGEKCAAPDKVKDAISSTTIAAASAGGVLAILSVVGIVLVVVKRRRMARRNSSPLTDQSEPAGSKDSDVPVRWLSPADQGHPYAGQGHPPEGQGHPIVGQGPPKAGQGPRYVENAAFSASSQAPPNSEMGYWRPVQLEADDEENSEGWVAYTQAQAPPELGSHSSLSSAHQPQ